MNERLVSGPDGRFLQVFEGGAPDGVPVLMLHGTPSCGLIADEADRRARAQGVRLLAYARPGYGDSTPAEGRNVADCAADVRAIAGALDITRLAVWGISGGGPHAAACAALLQGLVPAVALLGSPAPYGAPGLDFFSEMGELNVQEIELYLADPVEARRQGQRDREDLLAADLAGLLDTWRSLLAPVDAALVDGPLGTDMVADIKRGLAPGDAGWWEDNVAHLSDWGFGLSQIRTPTLVVHGRHDRFVPFAHGLWLTEAIPGAEARLLEDEGHLSLLTDPLDDVHAWLLERF